MLKKNYYDWKGEKKKFVYSLHTLEAKHTSAARPVDVAWKIACSKLKISWILFGRLLRVPIPRTVYPLSLLITK